MPPGGDSPTERALEERNPGSCRRRLPLEGSPARRGNRRRGRGLRGGRGGDHVASVLSILMRHAQALTLPVAALPVGMIRRAFGRSLMPPSSLSHLSTTTLLRALGRAGSAAAAAGTERDQPPAVAANRELQRWLHRPLVRASERFVQVLRSANASNSCPPVRVKFTRKLMAVYKRRRVHRASDRRDAGGGVASGGAATQLAHHFPARNRLHKKCGRTNSRERRQTAERHGREQLGELLRALGREDIQREGTRARGRRGRRSGRRGVDPREHSAPLQHEASLRQRARSREHLLTERFVLSRHLRRQCGGRDRRLDAISYGAFPDAAGPARRFVGGP